MTNGGADTIKGNGIPKTISIDSQPFDSIDSQPFDSIDVSSSAHVDFTIGDTSSIEVTADSNLLEFIELNYFGDTLDVGIKPNTSISSKNPIKVKIVHPHLKGIDISGSSIVKAMRLSEAALDVRISGSGNVVLSGKADKATLKVSGSGNVDAIALEVKRLKAKISGAGNMKGTAKDSVSANVSGAGNITIYGNPVDRQSNCSGAGNVRFI